MCSKVNSLSKKMCCRLFVNASKGIANVEMTDFMFSLEIENIA